jgi:hypothetical protein
MVDKPTMLRLVMMSALTDEMMFALGGVMALKDGSEQDQRAVERRVVEAADSLAATLGQFPDLEDYDLAFVRVEPQERLRRAAAKVAGAAVVAAVAGLAPDRATIHPEYPSGELEWDGEAQELLDGDPLTEGRLEELRPVAVGLIAALIAPGWASLLTLGVPARATSHEMNRAAALARRFFPDEEEKAFAEGHHRAATILGHSIPTIRLLADLLLASNSVPWKVVAGIVQEEIGPKVLLLRSGLFPPRRA